jgi:hypothetical protein
MLCDSCLALTFALLATAAFEKIAQLKPAITVAVLSNF